jgi:hypothetical protein
MFSIEDDGLLVKSVFISFLFRFSTGSPHNMSSRMRRRPSSSNNNSTDKLDWNSRHWSSSYFTQPHTCNITTPPPPPIIQSFCWRYKRQGFAWERVRKIHTFPFYRKLTGPIFSTTIWTQDEFPGGMSGRLSTENPALDAASASR